MYGTCYRITEDKEEDGMQVNIETSDFMAWLRHLANQKWL